MTNLARDLETRYEILPHQAKAAILAELGLDPASTTKAILSAAQATHRQSTLAALIGTQERRLGFDPPAYGDPYVVKIEIILSSDQSYSIRSSNLPQLNVVTINLESTKQDLCDIVKDLLLDYEGFDGEFALFFHSFVVAFKTSMQWARFIDKVSNGTTWQAALTDVDTL